MRGVWCCLVRFWSRPKSDAELVSSQGCSWRGKTGVCVPSWTIEAVLSSAFVGFWWSDINEICPLGCSCSAHLRDWTDKHVPTLSPGQGISSRGHVQLHKLFRFCHKCITISFCTMSLLLLSCINPTHVSDHLHSCCGPTRNEFSPHNVSRKTCKNSKMFPDY